MDMLRKPVVAAAQAGGYVPDGFPRTVEHRQRIALGLGQDAISYPLIQPKPDNRTQ